MNALGNLHVDVAIPVTVAAMSLKVIRVSHKTPFMLRRGYEDLSGAVRGAPVRSPVFLCALLRACAPVRSPAVPCASVWSSAVLCAPVRSCAVSCAPVRSCALLHAAVRFCVACLWLVTSFLSCVPARSPVCLGSCALSCALSPVVLRAPDPMAC